MTRAIPVEVVTIATSLTNKNGFWVKLRELGGERRVQLMVGVSEAQAMAVALENIVTFRPLSHSFFNSVLNEYSINLKNVLIHSFDQGVFFAKAIFESPDHHIVEVDCRPSDGICLALQAHRPILVDEALFGLMDPIAPVSPKSISNQSQNLNLSLDQLIQMLNKAIDDEDFELASKIQALIDQKKSKD